MPSTKKLLQAAAGNAGGDSLYVEDVFSTYLYDGNGSTQTITNGIDLDGEGGLTWIKARDIGYSHQLFDTERGATKQLYSNTTDGETTAATSLTSFNSDGFSLGALNGVNNASQTFASWSFRKAEKFFDVVTYTGDGVTGRTVSHNLGSLPGFILVKCTSSAQAWAVYHRSESASDYTDLTTAPFYLNSNRWNGTEPTESEFTCGNSTTVNQSGETFVAYLFASDAGGFGDDGDENIIKCGSYTGATSGTNEINLGFEPQWVMIKGTDRACDWVVFDNMRPWPTDGTTSFLRANTSGAEASNFGNVLNITPTGFSIPSSSTGNVNEYNEGYIYIAIRRPMKTPESGTEVFSPYAYQDTTLTSGSGTASNRTILNGGVNGGTNFPVDMFMGVNRTGNHPYALHVFDRLRGKGKSLLTNATTQEPAGDGASNGGFDFQEGVDVEYNGQFYYYNTAAGNRTHIGYFLKRATGFMDVVAYSGSGSATTLSHNLKVVPELMIVKQRSGSGESWTVWNKTIAATNSAATLWLNSTSSVNNFSNRFNSTAPTSSVFSVAGDTSTNGSGSTYVNYLFATLAGVSKVGSYTGTGSNVDVDCGFSAGARFILIKRTDSTGDWYYWDSARGIIAGNDPYQLMNSTAAEVTNTDYVDPLSSGFTVTSSAPAALNASGGSYIFLAIA